MDWRIREELGESGGRFVGLSECCIAGDEVGDSIVFDLVVGLVQLMAGPWLLGEEEKRVSIG